VHRTYIYNIRTLSVNRKFICTSFRNRQNGEPSASFSGLFRSEYKWILYLTTMYVYCVYPAMSKKVRKLVRFKQKGQKQASFLAFHKCCQGCLLRGPRYISTSFILVCALRCCIATGYQESLFVGWKVYSYSTKVYSSSTNKAKIYSYSIFVQQMYWLQDKYCYDSQTYIYVCTLVKNYRLSQIKASLLRSERIAIIIYYLFSVNFFRGLTSI
jgi:hypothetical protein